MYFNVTRLCRSSAYVGSACVGENKDWYSESGKRLVKRISRLKIAKEDEIPELLSGVSRYLDEKTKEISRAFEYLETWESYLRGYQTGMLTGLKMASEIVSTMSDRAAAVGSPWLVEPYPLNGLTSSSNLSP